MAIHADRLAATDLTSNGRPPRAPLNWADEAARHRRMARSYLERLSAHRRWLAAAGGRDAKLPPFYRLGRDEAEAAIAAAGRHRTLSLACAARASAEDRAYARAQAA